jgi:hypothetical protein
LYKLELGIIKLAHADCLAPALETSKSADMEKKECDIPMNQTNDEVEVVDEDRIQSNIKGHFSTLMF